MRYVLTEDTARKLKQMMRGVDVRSSRSQVGVGNPGPSEFAHPFRVHWAASVEAWVIWLPANSFSFNGAYMDATTELDEAGGDYPSGWYQLPDGGGAAWLTVVRESGETKCKIETNEPDGAAFAVKLASMSRDAVTHVTKVQQLVCGALVVDASDRGCWSISSDGHFLNKFIRVGSSLAIVSDDVFDETVGGILLTGKNTFFGLLINQDGGMDGSLAATPFTADTAEKFIKKSQELSASLVPLYEFDENGNVLIDFRICPHIQEFEFIGSGEEP